MIAKYFKLPSKRKNNENNTIAKMIRMTRSDCPILVFIPHTPFLFFYSIAYLLEKGFQKMLRNIDFFMDGCNPTIQKGIQTVLMFPHLP